jgi:hypothetical protein
MRTWIVAVCTALALAGCGGGSDDGGGSPAPQEPEPVDPGPVDPAPSDPNALDQALRGTWVGPLTATVQGAPPLERQASLVVLPSGNFANVRGLCADGFGEVRATGTGRTATWTGVFSCSPTPVGGCTATVTYTSLTVTLNADDTLSAQGQGNVGSAGAGCVPSAPATVAFTGTKQ